jgi:hypothetical protein
MGLVLKMFGARYRNFKEMRLYVFSDPSLSPPDPVASRPTHLPELTILHGPNHLAVEI